MKKFILYTAALCLFILALKASPFNYSNPKPDDNPEPYVAIGRTVKDAMMTAHSYSANHRMLSGYCAGDINPNQQGYLELSMSNIQDLLLTAQKIQKSTSQKPTKFRLIFGNLSDASTEQGSIMMVVGLNNGNEILYDETEAANSLIYRLNDPIPCPRYCDIFKSAIIGAGGRECMP